MVDQDIYKGVIIIYSNPVSWAIYLVFLLGICKLLNLFLLVL